MSGLLRTGLAIALTLLLLACSSTPAPVEERSARASGGYRLSEQGLYRVQRGDTLFSIAFHYGLDWKDVASWNGIGSPYTIYPGQELRLTAPPGRRNAEPTTTRPAAPPPSATTRTAETRPASPRSESPPASAPAQTQTPTGPATSTTSTATGAAASTPTPAPAGSATSAPPSGALRDPDRWLWPTEGQVISRYNAADPARKGIDIVGTEGQGVVASAAGDVVYSGNGLIGFGELIIIKHSDSMLTAYAHNRRRLVQEGERVAAGSLIAEMGRNDQEKTMLHFELRIDGKPVDPLKYLPPR